VKNILIFIKVTILVIGFSVTNIYAQDSEKVTGTVGGEKLGDDGIVICVLGTQACMPVKIDKSMTVEYNGKETKITNLPFALYLEADIVAESNTIRTIKVDPSKTVICFAERKTNHDKELSKLLNNRRS
jgi:hypothetical protein